MKKKVSKNVPATPEPPKFTLEFAADDVIAPHALGILGVLFVSHKRFEDAQKAIDQAEAIMAWQNANDGESQP